GGAMFATDEKMAHALRMVANHGMDRRYYHDMIGVNSRLDTIQAAILSIKLPHLDRWNQLRRQFADSYDARLKDITGITIPVRAPWSEHVFHPYTLKVADGRRDALMTFLKDKGIPSMIYYPVPMHEQAAYTKLVRRRVSLENTEKISQEVLSLPMHPHLTVDEIDYIHDAIRQFFQQ